MFYHIQIKKGISIMSINSQLEIFKPSSLSIGDVFTSEDPIYQIPDYQRPYSWKDDQIEQLWDDIYEAYKNNKEDNEIDINYFLGSLIVVNKDLAQDIVDGQQRITTIMILLCVVRKLYPKLNEKIDPYKNPSVVKLKKILSCIATDNDLNRLRLQSDPSHESSIYKLIFDESIDFSKYTKPDKKEIETEPDSRYINTAVIFYNHLLELGEELTGEFINYLMNRVKLIKITCYDESFAIKLFQVLNDRGMDLSAADIIKSYLLSSLGGKDKQHKHDTFMNDWRICEDWVKELDDSLTDYFTYYEYYLLEKNPKKSLVDELKEAFRGKDSNNVLSDFKDFLECYKNLYTSDKKLINSFWYLPWGTYWATALTTAEHVNYNNKEELQKELLRFFYLNFISGKTLNGLKQTLFHLLSSIKKNEPIKDIKDMLEAKLAHDDIINIVLKKLKGEVYYEEWLKPVLAVIEYYYTDDDNIVFILLDPKSVNIEHIYPQNPQADSEWFTMFPDGEKYLNTLGNLTLLSGAKNRYAQNFTFEEKINIYQGFDKSGAKTTNKNGKLTCYKLTQEIINDYKSNKYRKKWNKKAVQDHYNILCNKIGEIFGIDVSSILY